MKLQLMIEEMMVISANIAHIFPPVRNTIRSMFKILAIRRILLLLIYIIIMMHTVE